MSQMHTTSDGLAFDLIDRLHKSMRVSGKTATALSSDLGVHRNTVNNYLAGRTEVDRRTLIAWAFATGVPFAWLETGEDEGSSNPDGPDGGGLPSDALANLTRSKQSRTRRTTTDRYLAISACAA